MSRSIDHVVLTAHSLQDVSKTLENLGFTATPRAVHPWGTANRLVQMDRVFLEFVEIADESGFPKDPPATAFNFGPFNRDWLARNGEGGSMLVLASEDSEADRAAFGEAGLTVHDPFSFERTATLPDGETKKVAFNLTFVSDPGLPDIGFFTCQQIYPENFWRPEFQTHANGSLDLAGIVFIAENPADHQVLFSGFTGERDMRSTGLGIDIEAGRHVLSIMTPIGFERRFGPCFHQLDADTARIAAIRLKVSDMDTLVSCLDKAGVDHHEHSGARIVPSTSFHGCALIFEQS